MIPRAPDPEVVDFVKALARANAARDIALLRRQEGNSGEQLESRRTAAR